MSLSFHKILNLFILLLVILGACKSLKISSVLTDMDDNYD